MATFLFHVVPALHTEDTQEQQRRRPMTIVFENPTEPELREKERVALARVGLSYSELAELAEQYLLTDEQREVWDEVKTIRFLLWDD
jgi:hypothetical protein